MLKETNRAAAGQVSKSAAEIYDEFFVPALFGPWAGPLCELAGISPGESVLDVACGSGATTRVAAERAAPGGSVTGLDCNPGMLEVARRRAPSLRWIEGQAEALPFEDARFDATLCQFGLMFFEDRVAALREMARVTRPGGRVAVSVWDAADASPGYAGMIALIDRMFGSKAADALRAPFVLGDREALQALLDAAGLQGARIEDRTGTARFDSIREWVRMDVRGWTLADLIDDDGFEALVAAAESELSGFTGPAGEVRFPAPALLTVWRKG